MYLRVFADITVETQKDLFIVDVIGMLKGTSLLRFIEKTSGGGGLICNCYFRHNFLFPLLFSAAG